MEIYELLWIKKRLEELYTEWYIAKGWKDKRSREKKIREVCTAISKYDMTLRPENHCVFDIKVALNSQFAGDYIGSIKVLENKIKEMKDK